MSMCARRASSCTRQAGSTTGRLSSIAQGPHDCGPCPLKPKCCPKAPERKIPRSIYEDARDTARALAGTEAFEQSRRDRKRVEMLFAHLKRILKLGRLRLRGPRGAQDEFTLAAIAQNLRRLAKLVARPPPAVAACVLRNRCGRQCHRVKAAAPNGAGRNRRLPKSASAPSLLKRRLLQQNLPIADDGSIVQPTAVPGSPICLLSFTICQSSSGNVG